MRQRLLHGDALLGVEGKAAFEEVDCERVGVWVERLERPTLLEGECAEVVARAVRGDGVEVVEGGSTENIEDESELVVVCVVVRSAMKCQCVGRTHNRDQGRAAFRSTSRQGCSPRSKRR